jgi:hypothetical protein
VIEKFDKIAKSIIVDFDTRNNPVGIEIPKVS